MHLPKTLLLAGILAKRASSKTSSVSWISPCGGDVYGPGTILAKWVSPTTIVSPSIKLCMAVIADNAGCSATMWPSVSEIEGVYEATVTVANVASSGDYYLEMDGGAGNKMRSPVFSLSPVGASAPSVSPGGSEPIDGSQPQAQAPLGPPVNSTVASVTALESPLYPGSPHSIPTSPVQPTSSSLDQPSAVATLDPNVLSAKSPPPTAAFAVPLAAVAAVVLAASGLFLNHRRKLGAQRAKDAERLSRTGTVSSYKSSASRGGSEVSHALRVLSRHHGYRNSPAPAPLFMPPDDGTKARRSSTRDAFPYPAYARWDPPAYGYVSHHRDPPTYPAASAPCRDGRPHLPQIATTGSLMSETDPATHAVLADYMLPSPTLTSSTSMPRCLLPAPQKLHTRDDGARNLYTDNPLGSPPSDRPRDQDLYARVEHKLSMYRRS
ncbi:hypothetical protein B0H11DRAFT_628991 [Mycena galericulata]|nr:hypothetical protein B0H11DRAFT_628991 [Mycena galericulata]